jgi:putative alpha-1,2-mannosidase
VAAPAGPRLAEYLSVLNDGAGRPHAWLGNQPSFSHPWVWHWLGRPASSQDAVARALQLWQPTPDGLPGNEDLGSLSAWWVWSALGLHPVTPGTADVALGRPVFERVVVTPGRGAATEIVRVGAGRHVASVAVDGAVTTRSWASWDPAERPVELTISTTDADDPGWGRAVEDRPRSWPSPAP